jgi:tRNA (guanosine-2'-O-)-methyltransferase
VTAVTEDLYDPHNISAVLRSCDGFGLQTAHIIEVNNPYRVSPGVAKGASKWLDIERHQNTTDALRSLKSRGFAICCTTPHTDDTTPDDLPLDRPVALVFGSEGPGISDEARAEADYFVRIPMFGFTESYNISVAAALTLQTVTHRVRSNPDLDWRLPQTEHNRILGDWASRTVKDADGLLQRLRNEADSNAPGTPTKEPNTP